MGQQELQNIFFVPLESPILTMAENSRLFFERKSIKFKIKNRIFFVDSCFFFFLFSFSPVAKILAIANIENKINTKTNFAFINVFESNII